MMNSENTITKSKNILIVFLDNEVKPKEELQYLMENFCGKVIRHISEMPSDIEGKLIYVCGNIEKLPNIDRPIKVIKELSYNDENHDHPNIHLISLGKVPLLIENAGVYFKYLFEEDDIFNKVKGEHEFQHLTESNKGGRALRKGIYLTAVSKEETGEEEVLHYRLLRCSSNLTGPTDNFRITDHKIMNTLCDAAQSVFEKEITLNHVLAQIYQNKKSTGEKVKETKAKIGAHSDKTKDMFANGLIAFCTFYDQTKFQDLKPSDTDRFDWCYKKTSGLTRLLFKLKKTVHDDSLAKEFTVVLYPNSAFIIPLSTNRLYTHEIRPSMLNIDRIPTRMGYVVRCSKTEAIFKHEQTYIKENDTLIKLEKMTDESMTNLKDSYYEENKTENKIEYGKVHFSMNLGDYQKPIY